LSVSLAPSHHTPVHDGGPAGHDGAGGSPHAPPMHWYPALQSESLEQFVRAVWPPQDQSTSSAAATAVIAKRRLGRRLIISRTTTVAARAMIESAARQSRVVASKSPLA
jgi:hypothetical protein